MCKQLSSELNDKTKMIDTLSDQLTRHKVEVDQLKAELNKV